MKKFSSIFLIVFAVFIFGLVPPVVSAQSAVSMIQTNDLAALSVYVSSLKTLLSLLENFLALKNLPIVYAQTVLLAPSEVYATTTDNRIYVSWTIVSDATHYDVYRRVDSGDYAFVLRLTGANSVYYVDENVVNGSTYRYKIRSCINNTCSEPAESNSITFFYGGGDTLPPSTPTNLSAVVVSSSQINLFWVASTDNVGVLGYKIYRNGSYLTDVATTSYSDTNLLAATTYSYAVAAYDAARNLSAQSSPISATTFSTGNVGGGGGHNVPAAPSDLRLEPPPTVSTIYLRWNDNSNNEDKFNIEREVAGSGNWFRLIQTGADMTAYTDSAVTAGTYYNYRVQACLSGYGCSNYTYLYNARTREGDTGTVTVPVAPSNLFYSLSENNTRVNLSWVDNSTNETRFEIYRQTGGVWNYLAQVSADTLSFRDTPPAGIYYYNVVACNSAGCSTPSNIIGPITIGASDETSTIPLAPSGLTATLSSLTGDVVLSWSDNSNNEGRFEIYYRLTGSTNWNYLYSLSQNSTSFIYPNHPYGTYEYLVKACNYAGCSESNIVSVTKKSSSDNTTLSAFIEGTITSSNNQPVADALVYVYSTDFSRSFEGVTNSQGNYRFAISPGYYWIEFFPPAGREDLLRPAPQSFGVAERETKMVNIVFETRATANKVISGRVAFSNGTAVIDAEIGAYSYASGEWLKTLVDGNGTYSLRVGPGKWKVGFRPINPETANWRFTNEFREVEFRKDLNKETQTVNFSVALAETLLKVKTVDDQGKGLSGVGVILDTVSSKLIVPPQTRIPPEFRKTDSAGLASFRVPVGRYYLRAFLPPEREFVSPDELLVNITSSEQKDVTIIFKRKSVFAEALIRGRVMLDTGRPTDAFVWGWSETGGFNHTRANENGEFSFPVALNSRWHIGAGKEINTFPYKAPEIVVEVKDQSVAVEIILTKGGAVPLPPAVEITREVTQTIVVQAQNGAGVKLPPAAAGTSGKVEVAIKPTIEAPSQPAAKVVSAVYDISIRDQTGQNITQLQKEVEIILPYDEEELRKQGVTENSLIPSYFDETAGVWVKIDNYTIDKEKNIIIARVKHLTRFAIVAAADVIPPLPPTALKAMKGGAGEIILFWINPTSDFSHVKIYRSTVRGTLGTILINDLKSYEYSDREGIAGTTYYYTVRAVDPAGNESANTNQVSEVMTYRAARPSFLNDLRLGSRGEDIKLLQQILINEGVYPAKIISGFFGVLTKAAVVKFQEKYFAEILEPAELTRGTGFVGPRTRAKLNKLIP